MSLTAYFLVNTRTPHLTSLYLRLEVTVEMEYPTSSLTLVAHSDVPVFFSLPAQGAKGTKCCEGAIFKLCISSVLLVALTVEETGDMIWLFFL
jgi:hypothetical protein